MLRTKWSRFGERFAETDFGFAVIMGVTVAWMFLIAIPALVITRFGKDSRALCYLLVVAANTLLTGAMALIGALNNVTVVLSLSWTICVLLEIRSELNTAMDIGPSRFDYP